jgi:integrase
VLSLKAFFKVSDDLAARRSRTRGADIDYENLLHVLFPFEHMLTKAREWKLISDNPFRGVQASVPKTDERVLGRDEETKLLAACDLMRTHFLRPVIVLALGTGMRRGELLSLEWSQVDPANRAICMVNAKSNAGSRTIPMNASVHGLLSGLGRTRNSHLVFPSNRKPGRRILDLKTGFHKAV